MKNIKKFLNSYSKSIITVTILLTVLTGLVPHTVQAVEPNDSGLPPFDAPHSPYQAHVDPGGYGRCDIGSNEAVRMLGSWPSPPNIPTRDLHHPANKTIMGGEQTKKDFQMNILGHNCTRNIFPESSESTSGPLMDKDTYKSRIHSEAYVITGGTSLASINGATGEHRTINWRSHTEDVNNTNDYFYVKSSPNGDPVKFPFELEVPEGYEGTLDIEMWVKWAVEYKPGSHDPSGGSRYACANPEHRAINNLNDVDDGNGTEACNTQKIKFSVEIERKAGSRIQGIKVAESGVSQSQVDDLEVQVDDNPNMSDDNNPFGIDVPSGEREVSVETGGYDVQHTYCINRTDCHGSAVKQPGNSFIVDAPDKGPNGNKGEGYVDVRFYFRDGSPDGSSAIRGKKVDGDHNSSSSEPWYSNLVTAQSGSVYRSSTSNPFSFTSLPSRTYTVSVADEPNHDVRWIYCRSVESGNRQMVNRVEDDGSCEFENGSRRSGTGNSFNVQTNPDEQIYTHFIFEAGAELETNTTSPHRVATPGDSVSIGAYVKNVGEGESDPVQLRVAAVSGTNRISPNREETDVGILGPDDREDRSFSFDVSDNAQEGDKICFKSRARESGESWVSGNREACVGVVRNFDMRTQTHAPNGPEDELTGPFRVTGIIENLRRRARDGMSTHGHNYIEASISVKSGKNYVKPLYNGSSQKAGEPTRKQSYKLTWEYSGNGNEFFHPQQTPDRDIVRAWTEVKKNRVKGEKQVCFEVRAVPRYRHKTIFQNYSGWGGIDTGSSYASVDCTELWEVRAPYVTTEDGDVHGGSVAVDPETANQQCQNDNANVEGRTTGGSTIGSKSTYAVSATGLIRNFGSNNSTNDGRLKFGNQPPSGNYQAICRPDLTNMEYYQNLGYEIVQDNRLNIRNIINQINNETGKYSNGDEFVVRLTHPNPRVQGNNVTLDRGKRATFVTENRGFDIRSDVRMEGGSRNNVSDIPALAIVAGGDIDIYKDVGNIHAYISSNGTVDTCGNVSRIDLKNRAPRCEDWLRIRGALIANEIEFRRTSGDVGNSGPAEIIVYAPELYLSPPPGVMGITNNIFFGRPLWERLPFF